ncbi:hypothetical protein [Massilia sp.]|uniref:hypothetical protein n=1 Tax=Massilia sp. TaxID=1882437 RepID=UPI00391D53C0
MSRIENVQERLQRDYRLRVLRIYMDTTSSEKPLAVFTLTLGSGLEVALLTASMPELGFDERARDTRDGSLALPDRFAVPAHVTEALKAWLAEDAAPAEPLWMRLSVPLGLLAAIPWEELLQPVLRVPILRLPYQALMPRIPPADIDTVVCISSPHDEPGLDERIEGFIHEVPMELAQATRFHLFGNSAMHAMLCAVKQRYEDQVWIQVYDPGQAGKIRRPGTNPWLAWMEAEMGQGSTDVVHFLCHGAQELDEGSLLLAADPVDGGLPACVLDRETLITFLDHLGAWCVAFTSAPAERSAAGMRLLQTAVAQHRPGPVLVHDMNVAGSRAALRAAYRFLFNHPCPPPAVAAVALYCHPTLLAAHEDDQVSREQLARFTLDRRLGGKVSNPRIPWLASSQRKLEATAGELADAVGEGAVGRARARKLVLNALAMQAAPKRSRRGRSK